jgi:uncharacterized membrane protein
MGELKVLIVFLVTIQLFIKLIHTALTNFNLFVIILFSLPLIYAVSWYRKSEKDLNKKKFVKYLILVYPFIILLEVLMYTFWKYGYISSAIPETATFFYINFTVWSAVLIFAVSTLYTQRGKRKDLSQ